MAETPGRRKRAPKVLPGITRADSDDELGTEDHPWEWIYNDDDNGDSDGDGEAPEEEPKGKGTGRKRKRSQIKSRKIIAARMGSFQCQLGDTVLLKAEGSNEAWVGIICNFQDDEEEDEKVAEFMWFSTEKEIRKSDKKRQDCLWVRYS